MKKSGFTLAEVLIAVGIIGVMGAIMATTFNNVKPDRTKFLYLKAYDGLKASINAMTYDKYIYDTSYSRYNTLANECRTYDVKYFPLLDFSQPRHPDFSDIPGDRYKFANLLRESLNGSPNDTFCSSFPCTFRTKPGNIQWSVDINENQDGLMNAPGAAEAWNFVYTIGLTITGNNNIPNNFTLNVYADGSVRPNDEDNRGLTYIMNRTNLRSGNDRTADSPTIPDLESIQISQEDPNNSPSPEEIYYSVRNVSPTECNN